jgi:D-glycero-alpha-D-manno-heptose-7-phosphate kinase
MIKGLIMSRTPLRVSFIGGGSDFLSYYNNIGYGRVISSTIDKYIYIILHNRNDKLIRASYSKTEVVQNLDELQHELIRESLKFFKITDSIEIISISDVTGQGTGLGSSSSYTVGLLNAISRMNNKSYSKYNLATDACSIEIDSCKKPIGKQDQFAAAFGGMNEIIFNSDGTVDVCPMKIPTKNLNVLENNLMLFNTNIKRESSDILFEQYEGYKNKKKLELTKKIVMLGDPFKKALIENIDDVGRILNEIWQLKKNLASKITNSEIDNLYDKGLKFGALGGKLCGAGGGGFLMLYVKPENQESVRRGLSDFKELKFKFDYEGAVIL